MVRRVVEGHLEAPPGAAASALAWLVMAGVDTPVDDAPRAWLKAPAQPMVRPAPRVATASHTMTAMPAPSSAAATFDASSLPALAEAVAAFAHPLRRADLTAHLFSGATDSGVLVLCDQPEPAGSPVEALRSRMLAAIGLDAASCALLHRLPWPTTGARAPRSDELAAFAPFVGRALALIQPRVVLALGQHAAALAGEPMAVASARGRWATLAVGETQVPLLATCHPRLLLAQPARKRDAWADLQAFAARIRGEG